MSFSNIFCKFILLFFKTNTNHKITIWQTQTNSFLYVISAVMALVGAKTLKKTILLLHFVACVCLFIVVVVFLSIEESISTSEGEASYIEVFIPFVAVISLMSLPSFLLYRFLVRTSPKEKQEGICDCCYDTAKYSFDVQQQPDPLSQQPQAEKMTKVNEAISQEPKNRIMCLLCFDNYRQVAFLPCGHISCCVSCAETVRKQMGQCPICRQPIKESFRAYLA